TIARIHDLKWHYERLHFKAEDTRTQESPHAVGPARNPLRSHTRTSSYPSSSRSTPKSRVASLSATPTISSPLTRQVQLPDPDSADGAFMASVDHALGQLAIASPNKKGGALADDHSLASSHETNDLVAARREANHSAFVQVNEDEQPQSSTRWTITIPDFLRPFGLAVIEEIKAILCFECGHCIQSSHVFGHLRDRHKNTTLGPHAITAFAEKNGLNRSAKEIITNVMSSKRFTQCSSLSQKAGWWCEECGYATTSEEAAKSHERSNQTFPGHGFTPSYLVINGDRHLHQRAVILGTIQTLFPLNVGGYIPSIPQLDHEELLTSTIFESIVENEKDLFEPEIIAQKDPRSVHPFIKISGFQRWIGNTKDKTIERLQARMEPDASWGPRLKSHCRQMMEQSFSLCVPQNYNACCHVNSPTNVIETMPFGEIVSESALKRYSTTWSRFIAYLINSVGVAEEECRFGLSVKQQGQLIVYMEFLDNPESDDNQAVEALTFLSATLFCHVFGKDTSSEHPLITYCILSNIQLGNIIANPVHISPFLAAMEYFCRTTIMVYSRIAHLSDPRNVTFYDATRKLSAWLKEGENTPFAWIRQMLHLTAKFAYGSNQMPRFVWGIDDGQSYTFDGYRIQVNDFISMVRGTVREAVSSFHELWKAYGLPSSQ
ncbi:hypothetical protein FRC01_012128, partial [Tulasnella sp. 417]